MKLLLFILLVAFLLDAVSCVDYDGFAVMPYCFNVTNGQFTLDDEVVNFKGINIWGVNNAVFVNGMNLGLDSNAYWAYDLQRNASFLNPNGAINGTNNPFLYKAAYWDFGIAGDNLLTYGLGDGTWDTVDLAMAFAFNQTNLKVDNSSSNLNIYCSDHGVEVHNDNTLNDLQVVQHFYAARWQYESWARAVAVVKNPTNAAISVRLGFNNNLGSDGDTVIILSNSRYVVTADALNDTALQAYDNGFGDNPISMHWMSKDTTYPAPTVPDQPFDSPEDFNPYWDVTIKAGETQSFMMVLVQNRLVLQEAIDNATYIDSNPLKIYDSLSSDILSTLKNFNACAASVPEVTVTETSSCNVAGGSASLTVSGYDLSFALTLVDSSDTKHSVVNNAVTTPEGDYALVLQLFSGCEHVLHSGSVSCPKAPIQKTSTSSYYSVSAILMLVLSFVWLC